MMVVMLLLLMLIIIAIIIIIIGEIKAITDVSYHFHSYSCMCEEALNSSNITTYLKKNIL